jgi:cysteine synthase A
MFRHALKRFTTTAYKAAETLAQMEGPNQYGIQVAKAQRAVNGFVGGMRQSPQRRPEYSFNAP